LKARRSTLARNSDSSLREARVGRLFLFGVRRWMRRAFCQVKAWYQNSLKRAWLMGKKLDQSSLRI
jgi:hypothetical protein